MVKFLGLRGTMDQTPIEIAALFGEIEKALEAKLYYLVIAVALSVPDICASLELDPDKPRSTNGNKYICWADANIVGRFQNITGIDLYRLRCGVFHQGHFDHQKSAFDRVMFIGPESMIKAHDVVLTVGPGVTFGGQDAKELSVSGRILQLDVMRFCRAIIDSARTWAIGKAGDTYVQRNLPYLVRYRPDGLPPFSVGVPTVA